MADIPAPGSSLIAYQAYIKAELGARGFDDETISEKFMLLIEEVGELAKAARKAAGVKMADDAKRTNLSEEFGDVLILTLDLCNKMGIDAEAALRDKEEKNKQRKWS